MSEGSKPNSYLLRSKNNQQNNQPPPPQTNPQQQLSPKKTALTVATPEVVSKNIADASRCELTAAAHFGRIWGMPDVIERATSGRATCRGCAAKIKTGELRFGEAVPNPFADGETTLWFHLACAAFRRPSKLAPTLRHKAETLPQDALTSHERSALLALSEQGEQYPRLERLCNIERAPSGRAKCRCCESLIDKGGLRIGLEIFADDRFTPIGFIHLGCHAEYFGCALQMERTQRHVASLLAEDLAELEQVLSGTGKGAA